MKFVVYTILALISITSYANCLMRVYVDPVYSKNVLVTFEKNAKAKKYKIIKASDDRWEHFRLFVTSPGITVDGAVTDVVSVGLQKFASPNFEYAYQKAQPVAQGNRDLMALDFLKDLPSCPQTIYADVFSSLKD